MYTLTPRRPSWPRQPYDDSRPEYGYMESDRDFVLNNLEVCVFLLEYLLKEVEKNGTDNQTQE